MENTLLVVKQAAFITLGSFVGGVLGIIVTTVLSLIVWVISYGAAAVTSTADLTNEPLPLVAALALCTIAGVLTGMITGIIFAYKKVTR